MDFAQRERDRYGLRPGDLLVCEGGEVGRTAVWAGALEPCYYQKAIHRVRPRTAQDEPRFFFYLMHCLAKRGVFTAGGNPNTIDHLTADQLRHYRFPFPPSCEQRTISAFLNRESSSIDALIAKKKRLIELLEEKRSSLITRAITKGLNLNVPMKPSGFHGLGEIPSHWKPSRLKDVCERVFVGVAEAATFAYVDQGVPLLRSTDVRANRVNTADIKALDPRFADGLRSKRLKSGDIVTVRTGNAGVSAVVPTEFDGGQCFTLVVSRPAPIHDSAYICYCLNTSVVQQQFAIEGVGTAQINISVPIVQNAVICVPPPEEQRQIARHVTSQVEGIEILVRRTRDGVDRLKELRTALISAAVTGKIDVRDVST